MSGLTENPTISINPTNSKSVVTWRAPTISPFSLLSSTAPLLHFLPPPPPDPCEPNYKDSLTPPYPTDRKSLSVMRPIRRNLNHPILNYRRKRCIQFYRSFVRILFYSQLLKYQTPFLFTVGPELTRFPKYPITGSMISIAGRL